MKRAIAIAAVLAIAFGHLAAGAAKAQGGGEQIRLIRDAEIEATIRAYAHPIFRAAGMSADSIAVHIVNDERLNAFVAGGRHMFLNTGLIMRAEDPGTVIGVIAHETGHIVGGHLVRMRAEMRDAQIRALISFLLGAVAAAASGDGSVGAGVATIGQQITEGTFFQYTRTQERSADQFAVQTLDRIGMSARGLAQLLGVMREQEFLVSTRQDPYMRTHPLTAERLAFVEEHLRRSPHTDTPMPANLVEKHARMRAKMFGFLTPPDSVHRRYRDREDSVEARYARAVAFHRQARTREAIEMMDSLLREAPKDPYFHELKGQILFESGRVAEASRSYRTAVQLAPREPLIRTAYAHTLVELDDRSRFDEALRHLREASRADDNNPLTWRLLGVVYGRTGDFGNASLAMAEHYVLMRDLDGLRGAVARAEKHLKRGSPGWQRLQDIKALIAQVEKNERRR